MKKELTCAFLCLIIGMIVSVTIVFVAMESTEVRQVGEPLCCRQFTSDRPCLPEVLQ